MLFAVTRIHVCHKLIPIATVTRLAGDSHFLLFFGQILSLSVFLCCKLIIIDNILKVKANDTQRTQRAKKVVSHSPGLVDFSIQLVNSVFNLPDRQVMFLRNSNNRRTVKSSASQKVFGAS